MHFLANTGWKRGLPEQGFPEKILHLSTYTRLKADNQTKHRSHSSTHRGQHQDHHCEMVTRSCITGVWHHAEQCPASCARSCCVFLLSLQPFASVNREAYSQLH